MGMWDLSTTLAVILPLSLLLRNKPVLDEDVTNAKLCRNIILEANIAHNATLFTDIILLGWMKENYFVLPRRTKRALHMLLQAT